MEIIGGKLAGIQEAILSANEEVGNFDRFKDDQTTGPPRPRIGDSLSVHLSQDARSKAVWELTVFVQVAQGWFVLGKPVVTTPPNIKPAPGNGDPAARTVAMAGCPGAIGWKVVCRSDTEDEYAEILIQSREGASGGLFGVFPIVHH